VEKVWDVKRITNNVTNPGCGCPQWHGMLHVMGGKDEKTEGQ